jgi:type II secretory ATPase GspE/PulE/Tfp pilus assembly ATPase PilB-like protein
VQPEVLAGNLIGIVAQRLVRKLCTSCRVPGEADPIEARLLGCAADAHDLPRLRLRGVRLHRLSRPRRADRDRPLEPRARRAARGAREPRRAVPCRAGQGFVDLAEAALRRVRAGVTTLEEAARVVDLTERVGA